MALSKRGHFFKIGVSWVPILQSRDRDTPNRAGLDLRQIAAPSRSRPFRARRCCCIPGRRPGSIGRSTSMPSSRRASISPITAHVQQSSVSISRWNSLSTLPPALWMCSPGDYPGAVQFDLQWLLCCDKEEGTLTAVTKTSATGPRGDHDTGQRHRDSGCGQRQDVQSIFHNEAPWGGYWPRSFPQLQHHRQAAWRFYRGRHASISLASTSSFRQRQWWNRRWAACREDVSQESDSGRNRVRLKLRLCGSCWQCLGINPGKMASAPKTT